jgi:hypothetical protein
MRIINLRIYKARDLWFEYTGILLVIDVIWGGVVTAKRELLYHPPKTIQVKARKRSDKYKH